MHKVVGATVVIYLLLDARYCRVEIRKSGRVYRYRIGWDWQLRLRMPPLFDPRAVEIDIFADLTITKEKRLKCQRKLSFYSKFLAYYFLKVHLHTFQSQNSRNKGSFFCLLMEGSGS